MEAQDIQVLVAPYPDEHAAEVALQVVERARRDQGLQLLDAAVVRRGTGPRGRLHIHETSEVTGGRGAIVGGVFGGVLGILAGPAGIAAGAALGAVVGGAAATMLDSGIPHHQLDAIGKSLQPGSAALVALVPAGAAAFVTGLFPDVEIATETLDAESARRIGHDHDVAVRALQMGEALADGGMASPTEDRPTA